MDTHLNGTPLAAVPPADGVPGDENPGQAWSFIPPKEVRRRYLARIRAVRRPAGSLALPTIAGTTWAWSAGSLPHGDTTTALCLAGLVVFYDTVRAVCRTWQSVHGAGAARAGADDGRAARTRRAA